MDADEISLGDSHIRQQLHYSIRKERYSALTISSDSVPVPSLNELLDCTDNRTFDHQYTVCQYSTPGLITSVRGSTDNADCYSTLISTNILNNIGESSTSEYTAGELNFHTGMYMKSAFWAIPFYNSETLDGNRVWGYVVQRLMFLTGANIFVDRSMKIDGSIRKTNKTIMDKISAVICKDSSNFSNLSDSKYNNLSFTNFKACLDQFISVLIADGHLSDKFVTEMNAYLHQLQKSYSFPRLKTSEVHSCDSSIIFNPVQHKSSPLASHGNDTSDGHTHSDKKRPPLDAGLLQPKLVQNLTCGDYNTSYVDVSKPKSQYQNIILIITFNYPRYEVIPYVELLYHQTFPRIIYCGRKAPHKEVLQQYKITFIVCKNYNDRPEKGALNYCCMVIARKMNYLTEGFFFISDDILLFPGHLKSLPFHRIWHLPHSDLLVADSYTGKRCIDNLCGQDFVYWFRLYLNHTQKVENHLQTLKKKFDFYKHSIDRLESFTGGPHRMVKALSDVYYVPLKYSSPFVELLEIFLEFECFLEIAIPTALHAIADEYDIFRINGDYVWGPNRYKTWLTFVKPLTLDRNLLFIHPFKLSTIMEDAQLREFYCGSMLPMFYDET